MISQYKHQITIFLTTVVTTACFFFIQNEFTLFSIIGIISLVLGFSSLYHFHIFPHKKDISNLKHFFNPDFIFHHIHSLILAMILFISSSSIIHHISHHFFKLCIAGIYMISIIVLQQNISKGYKKKFKYEQAHLHTFNIIKMIAVIFSTNMIVFLMSNQILSSFMLSFLAFILYYCLLQIFRVYHHSYKKKYIQLYIFIISFILSTITFFFSQAIVSTSLITISMFMIYYTLWGIFKHYLTGTLHKRIIIEHLLFMLLVISFVISQSYFWERTL